MDQFLENYKPLKCVQVAIDRINSPMITAGTEFIAFQKRRL